MPNDRSAEISTIIPYENWCSTLETKLNKTALCETGTHNPLMFVDSEAIGVRSTGEPAVHTFDEITSITPGAISRWILWVGQNVTGGISYMLYDIERYINHYDVFPDSCKFLHNVSIVVVVNNIIDNNDPDEKIADILFNKETGNHNFGADWEERNRIRSRIDDCFHAKYVHGFPKRTSQTATIDYAHLNDRFLEGLTSMTHDISQYSTPEKTVCVNESPMTFNVKNSKQLISLLIQETNMKTQETKKECIENQ